MWDQDEMVVFWFDRAIPAEDRKEFLDAMRSPDVQVEDQLSGGAIEPAEIEAYIVLAKTTVSAAQFVASRILQWRKRSQESDKPTNIRIERPGRAPINLAIATDEEVTIFITDGRNPNG